MNIYLMNIYLRIWKVAYANANRENNRGHCYVGRRSV